ncbi:kinase-like domain-containing protein [Spinellus fusiger]|nr:kinase-like domain-containing protein [Spinellus fusiger]
MAMHAHTDRPTETVPVEHAPAVHRQDARDQQQRGTLIQNEEDDHEDDHKLNGYQKICKIGEGVYGVVFKAKATTSGSLVAIKRIRLSIRQGVSTTTLREIAILKELKHPNVIKLLDLIQKDTTIYLVFEYFDIDLRKYMLEVGRAGLSLAHIKSFSHQLLSGLCYCHSHRILHRDLKPQNILIDRTGKLTIADFGLSRPFGIPMRSYTQQVITLWYRAPEILMECQHYSTAVDMWSVGCIMIEMFIMAPLFTGDSQIDQLFRIFQVLGTPNEELWNGVTSLKTFKHAFPVWKTVDIKKAINDIKGAVYASDAAHDLLKSLLDYDPSLRISALRAVKHPFFYEEDDS